MSDIKSFDESLLISELKNHNEKAFRKLFDNYYQDIYGYSLSLLKSKDFAEENVQDVFLKVWLNRENLDASKSFKSYLTTIARNQAFNTLNVAANDVLLKEEIFKSSATSHEQGDYHIREDDCKKLKKLAIKELPPKRKKIFKMSRKGKTYEEISAELGISVNTVKSQMSKALESMRLFFQAHDEILLLLLSLLLQITL
ncbi:RNA polymerase sigma-70 factor [Flavobacterium zepuense]|uniref:RNA polymerase sigma-70 factor n=1 Tax=Flavobacterium zepuense TaxID=2593302 RepID=A0A552VAG2_9FLAO|nr:RNA polymerase sigma-70 factor [Flavobacterium zepuense]TRW27477.1 RNA polymerase sigma-70 factor [Flavobacterium zepuense]